MSTYYDLTLGLAFRYLAVWDEDDVKRAVDMLIQPDYACESGSSFAVTADAYMAVADGQKFYRRLWLSEASYRRIIDSGEFTLCPDVVLLDRRERYDP